MQLNIHIPDDMWEKLEELPKAELVRLIRIGRPQKTAIKKKPAYSQNKKANAILEYVHQTGGLNGTGEEIRRLSQEFREDFEFRHDQ